MLIRAKTSPSACRGAMRGLTLVELMVGITVGLFIVAGATMLVSNQVGESRRVMIETQLQQDLRAATEIVVRDLRRAGYWGDSQTGLWYEGTAGLGENPYRALTPTQVGVASNEVRFAYSHSALENGIVDAADQAGFRLNNGVIEMMLGGAWQALTDTNTLVVTDFRITLDKREVTASCVKSCPVGSATCPPKQELREIRLVIAARARHDASVTRNSTSTVRLRNDLVSGSCPA